mgnify:CR=1 FL=1
MKTEKNPVSRKNTSHHASFTLIELLVNAACKVRVFPFYYLKIIEVFSSHKAPPYYPYTQKEYGYFSKSLL